MGSSWWWGVVQTTLPFSHHLRYTREKKWSCPHGEWSPVTVKMWLMRGKKERTHSTRTCSWITRTRWVTHKSKVEIVSFLPSKLAFSACKLDDDGRGRSFFSKRPMRVWMKAPLLVHSGSCRILASCLCSYHFQYQKFSVYLPTHPSS